MAEDIEAIKTLVELGQVRTENARLRAENGWLRAELDRRRSLFRHALELRHSIYYGAKPLSKLEAWANQLGGVLAAGESAWEDFDPAVLHPVNVCSVCGGPDHSAEWKHGPA